MFAPPQPSDEPSHDAIRLADWVEINLVLDEEPSISVTDITDELADIPPDEASDSERRFEGEDTEQPGFWGVAEEQAEAALGQLTERASWLGDHYPLEVDGDAALLRSEVGAHQIYRFLVSIRARQMYEDALGDDGESAGALFEELAKHALGAYVGAEPEHRVRFGVAGGHRGDGLPDSLSAAVEDLRQRLHEAPGEVPQGAQGDYKADAVAWKPFGDLLPGQLVVIGQATISEGDWVHEELPSRWTYRQPAETRLIAFLARPVTAVVFPETLSLTRADTLRGLAGTFSSIPLDRLRLLSILKDDDLPTDLRTDMDEWVATMRDRLAQ